MPPVPSILKKRGCTPKDWKKLFAPGPKDAEKLPKIKKLEDLIANRIKDGRLLNLKEYRMYSAIDLAYDAAFAQTTPTIIQSLLSRNLKQEEVLAQLNQWGISEDELFTSFTAADGTKGKRLNPPTFYKMLVPLVKGVLTIRRAKLFNERNQSPLLKYEPLSPNAENRLVCEVITSVVQVIAADYGYANDLKQIILQMLLYSFCLVFPREVWHTEYQLVDGGVKKDEKDDGFRKVLQKEGIRYVTPHPSKVSWDPKHNVSTFNTGTGCEWAQYWKVVAYSEIEDNDLYWNKKKVGFGTTDWMSPDISQNYFTELFPCTMTLPVPPDDNDTSREQSAVYYTTNERDKAVFQTDHFMRLVPSKWGMGDYNHPIWVRFVMASDCTVLYAEPICYEPMLYCGYDPDALRSKNPSMALEVLPTQDIIGNILSQILLTSKQNLANVNFFDENIINRTDIDKVKNGGEMMLRSLNMVGYDSSKNNRGGFDVKQAIHSVNFPNRDVTPLFTSINTIMAMLERLLQVSAQESGSSASHQQSAEEVKQTGGSSSNRVVFTGSSIDDMLDAMKRQQYYAAVAYLDSEVEAYVSGDIPDVEQHLAAIGFKVVSKGEGKLKVTGNKKALNIDALATSGKGPERKNDSSVAQVMMQAVTAVANNQLMSQAIGPKPLLKAIETAAKLAGADKDFKLRPDQKQEMDALMQLAQQITQKATMDAIQHVEKDVSKPVAKEIAGLQHEVAGEIAQIQSEVKQLQAGMERIIAMASGAQPQPPAPNAPAQPPIAPPGSAGTIPQVPG